MRVVKLFKYAIKAFFRRYNIYGTIKYLEKIMLNECDLITEAKNYKVLQKIFSAHNDLIIPEVHSSLCSRRVLTTKFYEGQRISEILPLLDLEEKTKLKQLVDRFYFYPIKRYNFIQIDPHLGNFLYCEGKLVCVDFGGMHLMRAEVGVVFNNYIKFANKADVISLYKLFSEEGLIDPELISLAIFTKYMAYAIIDPYGINNSEGINNLNYYFKNYPNEPLRSGVITKDSDLPLFVLTYFVFRSIEKRILS
jgi:predicted unusual protein kinase regulating ubiquinone biosynthesis (AarF/ABC1/UbiB family)